MSTTTAAQPADESAGPSTSTGPSLRRIPKGKRLKGESAAQFTKAVISAYRTMAIRPICEAMPRARPGPSTTPFTTEGSGVHA
ncbi:hypothetical protein STIB_65370 [Streptomyces sp. IB2014 011-1]|nr:hypothetical protein STIB_65370 [Streptomyces sp. IB2014 011-1]